MSLTVDTQDWLGADCVSIGDEGFGVLGSAIAATGDAGPGYAFDDLEPADLSKEICGRITTWPVFGDLYAFEDTGFIYTRSGDGADSFQYQLYVDGIDVGSPQTVTLTVGAVSATAAGATLTGTASITGGGATDGIAPVGGGGGVSGGAGSLREVRAFADLLSKRPTKAAKKRLRRVLEAEALELLPDEPEAIKAAQIIAQVVAKKELQAIERRPVTAAPLTALPFDPSAMIRRMVEEWERNEAIQRELEDEFEAEMLLMD